MGKKAISTRMWIFYYKYIDVFVVDNPDVATQSTSEMAWLTISG